MTRFPLPKRPTEESSLDHGPASVHSFQLRRIGPWKHFEALSYKLVGKFWKKKI